MPIPVIGLHNKDKVFVNGSCVLNEERFMLIGSFVAFFIPLVIMVVTYCLTIQVRPPPPPAPPPPLLHPPLPPPGAPEAGQRLPVRGQDVLPAAFAHASTRHHLPHPSDQHHRPLRFPR